jgi:hypothetical protein
MPLDPPPAADPSLVGKKPRRRLLLAKMCKVEEIKKRASRRRGAWDKKIHNEKKAIPSNRPPTSSLSLSLSDAGVTATKHRSFPLPELNPKQLERMFCPFKWGSPASARSGEGTSR